jgi:hypothetical protein
MFSTARRKRNHVLKSMRRASTQEIPPRSTTTTPHPPLCSSRSVVFNACLSRFHGFVSLSSRRTSRAGYVSQRCGSGLGGRMPRRGGSLSLSTCSPAQRATTRIRADSANTACFPSIEGIALSTPRIDSRGWRMPCTWRGFLFVESPRRVFLISLSASGKYEHVLRSDS